MNIDERKFNFLELIFNRESIQVYIDEMKNYQILPASLQHAEGRGGQACRGVKQAAMICLLILKKALANKSFF